MFVEQESLLGSASDEQPWPPQAEADQDVRDRLLRSARAVFLAHGFHGATIEEIVEAAGELRSTFYLHFADKTEALRALCELDAGTAAQFFRELDLVLVDGSRQALRAWLARACAWFRAITTLEPAWNETRLVGAAASVRTRIVGDIAHLLPGYLSACRPEDRKELELRLVLLVLQLEQVVHLPTGDQDAQEQLAVDVLTDIWWSTLHAGDGQDYPLGCGGQREMASQ
jgi:AcrR family transcriptional regulator